jgi:trimeric autotransporter adhesin
MRFLLLFFAVAVVADFTLPNSGVVPGIYYNAAYNVTSQGVLTSATSGSVVTPFTTITATGGTTVLTATSTNLQIVTGNNPHTIVLPGTGVATGYYIEVAASGLVVSTTNFVTVKDASMTTVGIVIARGSAKYLYTGSSWQIYDVSATYIGVEGVGVPATTVTGFAAQGTTQTCTSYGFNARATASGATALGPNTLASGGGSLCIGSTDQPTIATTTSSATAVNSLSIGIGTTATAQFATAIGQYSSALFTDCITIGHQATCTALRGTAVGSGAAVGATNTVAFGTNSSSTGANAVAVGPFTTASQASAVAFGDSATASGSSSIAVGQNSLANATQAAAFGAGARGTATGVVSVGANSVADAVNAIVAGTGASSGGIPNAISLGASSVPVDSAHALAIKTNAASHVPGGLGATLGGVPSFIEAYASNFATTAVAGATTTLTVSSAQNQVFTGTGSQTVVLPVVTTLRNGFFFRIMNAATGTITINSSGGNTLTTVATSGSPPVVNWAVAMVQDTAGGTGTASWVVMN